MRSRLLQLLVALLIAFFALIWFFFVADDRAVDDPGGKDPIVEPRIDEITAPKTTPEETTERTLPATGS